MPILDDILAAKRHAVARAKAETDMRVLEEKAGNHSPRGFRKRLVAMSQVGPAIIAELKKASPSKGVIRGSFPVGSLANQLAKNGASALSVLTEEEFFHGSLTNLLEASAATELPCLRKDFIVDEFQIIEARAHRADAVLLILAALNDADFRQFLGRARELQLDALCEVHDENEMKRALEGGAEIIGVNSRDLRTFEVKLDILRDLAPSMPNRILRIAESGIASGSEIGELHSYGYHAFLIGGTLMRASDPGKKLRQLLEEVGTLPQFAADSASWRGTIH
ncbi:MAG TPA: indole-3-glycerol phosphate synthase TrpC [Candidatus Angelobacter sp.]|jgi:indole-3-glycerol phosphate synthase|nr:indole-3-glycerol phosphate synthase TrpC [Candidatus Angelobacter sp.]